MENKRLKIFVVCLNWGIGHASRSLQVIHLLEKRGHEVILGGDGRALNFLRKELPNRRFIRMRDVRIKYHSETWRMIFRLINAVLKLKKVRRKEHLELHRINHVEQFDLVISDNRYGLFSRDIYSILITHQLSPKSPFGQGYIRFLIRNWTSAFNEVWIPDFEHPKLTGKLSKSLYYNTKRIGILSRFEETSMALKTIDYLFLLSGPEPLRSSFEQKILNEIKGKEGSFVLVRGTNTPHNIKHQKGLEIINLAQTKALEELLMSSNKIICRGGYSTIMDLVKLNLSAFLVPTPGQWEQEYLAKYLRKKEIFNSCAQSEFKLDELAFFEAPNINNISSLEEDVIRVESKLLGE